jgi:hypothetical protein
MALPNSEKITSQIAMLPDQALKQMAMMHKNDPYVLPLIISEDGRRKQMRQAAQAQMGGMPQPKVADAAVAQMGQLPEEQGIGVLPAPNMQSMADGGIAGYGDGDDTPRRNGMAQGGMYDFAQRSEPVLRMAGGGMAPYIPGYKDTGKVVDYRQAIIDEANRLGVPPEVALQISGVESNFDPNARPIDPKTGKPRSSATSFFQVIDKTFKNLGGRPEKRNDPMENIRIGVKSLSEDQAALAKKLGRAPNASELYTTHVLGAPVGSKLLSADPNMPISAFLDKVDPTNKSRILAANPEVLGGKKTVGDVLSWTQKKMAPVLTAAVPVGTAQAGEPPRPAAPDLASQIPGQRTPAPASTYDQTNSYFGRLADTLGIPPEYQRNIANTLNATSGFTSPISTANRAIGTTSKALEATPEMIANAEKAKQIAETQRLLPPAKAGLEALDEASQATRAAAEAARRARGVEQDVQAAKAAEQSIDAANMTSKIARTTEEAVAAGPNARALDSAKLANASKALAGTQLAEEKAKGLFAEGTRPEVGESVSGTYDTTVPPAEAEPKPSDVIAAAKEAVPAKERKGFDGEDLLMLGLNLMANKSPRFLSALGEAGIQTLTAKKEREKSATDLEYKDIMSKYYGSLGKKAEADAAYIASGEKGRMADRLKAATLIDRDLESWRKTMEGSMPQPGTEAAKRKELTNYYFGLFGLDVPATMASTAGVAIPEGVKVTRS